MPRKPPLVPRNSELSRAIAKAREPSVVIRSPRGKRGDKPACFNGSQASRRNKKRPITLPERA